MGIKGKGLTVDGYNYFSNVLSGKQKPTWMDFSKQIAKLTGSYDLLNMVTGLSNLDTFLFRTPKWPIGGFYFDGIMRTEHTSRVRATQYPIQTGVTMTDHAIIEPAELTIEIMMSDSHTLSFVSDNPILDSFYQAMQSILNYSNYMTMNTDTSKGEGRSINAWSILKGMQLSRLPITVETRLQTYNNMIIEELSSPDDVKTLNALKATVRMREIIVSEVAEVQVSARAANTQQSSDGQVPATTDINKTALRSIEDKVRTY